MFCVEHVVSLACFLSSIISFFGFPQFNPSRPFLNLSLRLSSLVKVPFPFLIRHPLHSVSLFPSSPFITHTTHNNHITHSTLTVPDFEKVFSIHHSKTRTGSDSKAERFNRNPFLIFESVEVRITCTPRRGTERDGWTERQRKTKGLKGAEGLRKMEGLRGTRRDKWNKWDRGERDWVTKSLKRASVMAKIVQI